MTATIAFFGAATAAADPGPLPPNGATAPGPVAVGPAAAQPEAVVAAEPPAADLAVDPAVEAAPTTACKQFTSALDYAATNYEDFAYDTAGGGNAVNYGDPIIQNSNVVGRTALREAASTAMGASMTPGLAGDISAPMQAWSLHATKLLFIMGLHGGGDSLNDAATSMNTDARNAQMACATALSSTA